MFRLFFYLLILFKNSAHAQTSNSVALHLSPGSTMALIAQHRTDTSLLKADSQFTPPTRTTVIIIPSKLVCRQRVTTFFLVADNTGTSENWPTLHPPTTKAVIASPIQPMDSDTTHQTGFDLEAIPLGAGSDALEMMLKTHGRKI
ncbi:hypothetical protein [Paraflavitalea speifideaquila]|uniref:hypothetical protein n=1 Tax=Paraflavitalea speifideaquila TaxID=3076558 RepID=UPI0028ED0BBE|nr:hypothetical protein [Paraflavitalea speifideiaquila]